MSREAHLLIDWQRAAWNIRKHLPLEQAAKRLGRGRTWLNNISRGVTLEVTFSDGVRLLDLHTDLCGPEATQKLRRNWNGT